MFLTVTKVIEDQQSGLSSTRVASIVVEDVIRYRKWIKSERNQSVEGEMLKVDMKGKNRYDEDIEYFILIQEDYAHFEQRINCLLWLKTNASLSTQPLPEDSSPSDAPNTVSP